MKSRIFALAALFSLTLLALAQDAKPTATAPAASSNTAPKPTTTKPAPKKPGEGVTAIVGGDVYTVTREIIRNGTVLMKDGKITAVGMDLPVPEGAIVVDARGKVVTPGFVAVSASNVGLRAALGNVPGGRSGGPIPGAGSRQAKLADSLNPYDRNIKFCLGVGITTANVEVNANPFGRFGRSFEDPDDEIRLCPCCNQPFLSFEPIAAVVPTERGAIRSAVIKMTYGDLAPMLVKENPFYHLPASALAGSLNRTQWRETVKKAKAAAKQPVSDDDFGDGMGGGMGMPQRSTVPPEVIALVKKEIPLRTEASSVDNIRDMIALAKELDYRLVLDDVVEGWVVPKELAEAGVSVIYTPRTRRQPRAGREENTGSNIESSRLYEDSGVSFSVTSLGSSVSLDGIAGRDLTSLPLEAMFAQRGGCSPQAALAALTIVPARQLGIANRVGSLEPGKDADLLILDGPPLDYRSYVEKAFVQGNLYYDRSKDRIYPDR